MADNPPPDIFSGPAQRRFRARAAPSFAAHDFLITRVIDDIATRLQTINRVFKHALILGTHQQSGLTELQKALPKAEFIFADITPAMLEGAPGQHLICADETLNLAPESIDLVISPLTLQAVNDLPGILVQIRKALKPDGLMLAALLGGDTLHELYTAFIATEAKSESKAESESKTGITPHIAPFADIRDLGGLMQRAHFALPVVDSDKIIVHYQTAFNLLQDLRGLGWQNALVKRRKTFSRSALFADMAAYYSENFAQPDGRIPATFEVLTLTGWAPHSSQQKPLKPGSAKISLAQVFGKKPKPE